MMSTNDDPRKDLSDTRDQSIRIDVYTLNLYLATEEMNDQYD